MDGVHQLEERANLAAGVGGAEVAAHTGTNVGGFAYIEHVSPVVDKQIDAGCAGKIDSEFEFGCLRVRPDFGHGGKLVEIENAEACCALDEQVQQVACGKHVVDGAVAGLMRKVER